MMKISAVVLCWLLVVLFLLGACTDKKTVEKTLIESGAANKVLEGAWRWTDGNLYELELGEQNRMPGSPAYIDFNINGTVAFYYKDSVSNINSCYTYQYGLVNDSTMYINFNTPVYFIFNEQDGRLTMTNVKELADEYVAVESVPDMNRCRTIDQFETFELDAQASSRSELIYDGDNLWFHDEQNNEYIPVDPAGGNLGTPFDLSFFFEESQYRYLLEGQGSDMWMSCFCGRNETLIRRDLDFNVLDTIDTAIDLDNETLIEAAAWDGSSLWVSGSNYETESYVILKIDSEAEPDVLIESIDTGVAIRGMSWGGDYFWATTGDHIVKFDPVDFSRTETYSSPIKQVSWFGTSVVGSDLFLIGESRSSLDEKLYLVKIPLTETSQ